MPSKIKTCEEYRDALIEAAAANAAPVASSSGLSRELRSHLDACASCSAAYAEEVQLFAAIEAGLRVTANAEVPASLLPRVRAECNALQTAPQRNWAPAWAALAVTAAAVFAIVLLRGNRQAAPERNPQENTIARSLSSAEVLPPKMGTAPPLAASQESSGSSAKNKQIRRVKTAPLAKSKEVAVLIPAGQKHAMDSLLASVRHGGAEALDLPAETPRETLQNLQVSPLEISPIEIKPLTDVNPESPAENEE